MLYGAGDAEQRISDIHTLWGGKLSYAAVATVQTLRLSALCAAVPGQGPLFHLFTYDRRGKAKT